MTKKKKTKHVDVIACAVITSSGEQHKFPIPLSSEIQVLKHRGSYVFERTDGVTVIFPQDKVVRVEYIKTTIEVDIT